MGKTENVSNETATSGKVATQEEAKPTQGKLPTSTLAPEKQPSKAKPKAKPKAKDKGKEVPSREGKETSQGDNLIICPCCKHQQSITKDMVKGSIVCEACCTKFDPFKKK